ncbi:AraC family transcriptional regulator [Roseibium sp.]|uniref:AraC family transcriptional regulator n=1 Tax=Roseibium sp. TaxID=1936156 RepID=UPI003A96E076
MQRDASIHPDHYVTTSKMPDMPVQAFAAEGVPGEVTTWHNHPTGQLFHVVRGSLAIDTEVGTFFAPPERAVWLPAGLHHQTRYLAETEVRYMYFGREHLERLPQTPRVLQVTTLLRALILEFMSYPRREIVDGPQARIVGVILDQLKMLPAAPLQLPMPKEARMRQLCERILSCPAEVPLLAVAAESCAMSVRSFERRVKAETGLSYRNWCHQAKLFRALELLSGGGSVSEVSHLLGYEGPSAFVSTFRKAFGVTPGRYFLSDPGI